jgi:hypothetical protein
LKSEKGEGGKKQIFLPVLKIPRQCPLVLPVKVLLRVDKALGSEKVNFFRM